MWTLDPKVSYEEHSPAKHLHKTETEKMVADLVPDHYDVRLHDPDLTILVIVAGGSAMLAVTRGYDASQKFHKFHVRARRGEEIETSEASVRRRARVRGETRRFRRVR